MTQKVVDFASKKRKACQDALAWSPRDALLEALEEIDTGQWAPKSLFIIGCTEHDNGAIAGISDFRAGSTRERTLALIEHGKKRLMDAW